jgi:aminoglycoside phosphotransferase (APT) family kinase protein
MAIASESDVADVVSKELGVTVLDVRRQTRWRPTWFVDAERDGEAMPLVVRGERVDTRVFPLRHEVRFHRLLEEFGIPVPHVVTFLDSLDAVVLEFVPGKPDFDGVPVAERAAVVEDYLQVLARVHALPLEPFIEADIYGSEPTDDPAVSTHYHLEKLWRAKKRHPNPFLEFCLGWLHRHPPRSNGRRTPTIWDSGQFHHQDGRLVAILDLEFGSIGDPMVDLAVWRMRDTLIPFGDFSTLYARYEEISGTPVDLEAIKGHHFAATLSNELIFGPAVSDPVLDTDLMNNMQWNSETNLHATEALGEYLGIDLPTEVALPQVRRTRNDHTYDHLVATLRRLSLDEGDRIVAHQLRLAFRTARHLERVNEIGDALDVADLDDVAELLGHRPASWWEADEELERFVLADAGEGRYDDVLLPMFHRRNLRIHAQLGPPTSKMTAHHRTQRFADVQG